MGAKFLPLNDYLPLKEYLEIVMNCRTAIFFMKDSKLQIMCFYNFYMGQEFLCQTRP